MLLSLHNATRYPLFVVERWVGLQLELYRRKMLGKLRNQVIFSSIVHMEPTTRTQRGKTDKSDGGFSRGLNLVQKSPAWSSYVDNKKPHRCSQYKYYNSSSFFQLTYLNSGDRQFAFCSAALVILFFQFIRSAVNHETMRGFRLVAHDPSPRQILVKIYWQLSISSQSVRFLRSIVLGLFVYELSRGGWPEIGVLFRSL